MVRAFALCVVVLTLASCASPEERAEQAASRRAKLASTLTQQCETFGYNQSTPQMSQCMQQMFTQDVQLSAMQQQQAVNGLAAGLRNAGAALQSIGAQPTQPTTCMSMPVAGGGVQTTCH